MTNENKNKITCEASRSEQTSEQEMKLRGLLEEVRQSFTRDDDLPGNLLPRIDAALDADSNKALGAAHSASAAARGPGATPSEPMAEAMPSPGLVYTDRQARDRVATVLGMPLSEARSYAWEYLLSVVKGLADDPTGEALRHDKRITMQLSETSCNDLRAALGTSEEPSNIGLYVGPSLDEDKEVSFGLHVWNQEYPEEGMSLIHPIPAAAREATEARGDSLVRIERAVTAYGNARATSAMDTATLKAELMCEIEAGFVAEVARQYGADEAPAAPDRKGVYAWVTSTGHAALVLVSKRPTEHCAGGTLNAVVMDSIKFYDGCAVDQWGKDGRWMMLHAFPEVPMADGANHD